MHAMFCEFSGPVSQSKHLKEALWINNDISEWTKDLLNVNVGGTTGGK